MMVMQMMMFSGGQFREGLERGRGVKSSATGSSWIYVLSFNSGWRMRVLRGHDCRVGRKWLRVSWGRRGRRLSSCSIIKEGRITNWWLWGCLLVAMSDNT